MLDKTGQWQTAPGDPTRRGRVPTSAAPGRARDDAARHSRRVRLLKILLPLLGVLILAGFGFRYAWNRMTAQVGLTNVLFTKDGVTMVEPHISGQSLGQTYDVTALRGIQSFDDAKKVRFEVINGRIEMRDRNWAQVRAPVGIFQGDKQFLRLEGGIDVTSSSGYHLTGQSADIAFDTGVMATTEPVQIEMRDATIRAGGARLDNTARNMLFSNGVTVTFTPTGGLGKAGDAPAGEN